MLSKNITILEIKQTMHTKTVNNFGLVNLAEQTKNKMKTKTNNNEL